MLPLLLLIDECGLVTGKYSIRQCPAGTFSYDTGLTSNSPNFFCGNWALSLHGWPLLLLPVKMIFDGPVHCSTTLKTSM
jgi:hypothetical protein